MQQSQEEGHLCRLYEKGSEKGKGILKEDILMTIKGVT